LTCLSLHHCGITSLQGLLSLLPALTSLTLTFLRLPGLDNLLTSGNNNQHLQQGCGRHLTFLDVSYNCINTWSSSWLAALPKLAVLDASYNQLADLEHLDQLCRWLTHHLAPQPN
jgi:Leucine-rich repeat (LRR) protein